MKKFLPLVIIVIVLVFGGLTYFSIQKLSNKYLASTSDTPPVVKCQTKGVAHQVVVKNDAMVPVNTAAHLCDTLTITNDDNTLRLIAFGPHEHHTPYDGVTEKPLEKGQSLTITLNQAGTYQFHEHIEDIAKGTFTVSKT